MRAPASIATIALVVLLLSGCLPQQSTVMPTPEPSSTPVFSSDEEALAAATAAYAAYLALSDQIFVDGGASPERLSAVAAGEFLAASVAGFKETQIKGWRSTGGSTFDSVVLQRYDSSFEGESAVTIYLCEDVSAVDVLDAAGMSVVSMDRPPRTLLAATFDLQNRTLLISSREPWGDKPC